MKKPLLTAAAFGMLSAVAVAPASAITIDLKPADYSGFSVLADEPAGSALVFYNPYSEQISANWLAASGPFSVFWGTETTIDDIETITAALTNSSITGAGTADDINFGLFVGLEDGGTTTFYTGTSVEVVADNTWFDLELDVTSLAASEGFDVADIDYYGLYIGSEAVQTAHAKVPEPSTLATLGAGLLAFGAMAARRKKQAA